MSDRVHRVRSGDEGPEGAGTIRRALRPGRAPAGTVVFLIVAAVIVLPSLQGPPEPPSSEKTRAVLARLDRLEPGWRLEPLEARRAAVPDADNGALRVLAVDKKLPPSWTGLSDTPLGTGSNPSHSLGALLSREPNRLLSSAEAAALRAQRDALGPALATARTLVQFPRGRFAVALGPDPLEIPLTHVHAVRRVARLLLLDALVRSQDGDIDGALESCRAAIHAGRAIGDEPLGDLPHVARMANDLNAVTAIERALAQGQASEAALAPLLPLLEDEARQPLLERALRGERAVLNAGLDAVYRGTVELNGVPRVTLNDWEVWFRVREVYRANQWAPLDELTRALSLARTTPLPQLWIQFQQFRAQLEQRRKDAPAGERAFLLLVPATDWLVSGFVASRTRLETATVGIAAERFRVARGQWPDRIPVLVPRFLDRVPDGPRAAGPFRLERSNGTLTILSAIPDDRQTGPPVPPKQGLTLDVLDLRKSTLNGPAPRRDRFRLWDPDRRRQGPRKDPDQKRPVQSS